MQSAEVGFTINNQNYAILNSSNCVLVPVGLRVSNSFQANSFFRRLVWKEAQASILKGPDPAGLCGRAATKAQWPKTFSRRADLRFGRRMAVVRDDMLNCRLVRSLAKVTTREKEALGKEKGSSELEFPGRNDCSTYRPAM